MARYILLLALLSNFFWAPLAWAAAGDLDSNFSLDGIVSQTAANVGLADNTLFQQRTVSLAQSDGKFFVSANADGANPVPVFLARFDTDGTLDANFGISGAVTFAINDSAVVHNIALQSDEKILLSGTYTSGLLSNGAFIARFNTDGSLDTEFGNHYDDDGLTQDGYALFPDEDYSFVGLAVNADNSILVAVNDGAGHALLARYSAEGELDTDFGTDGFSTIGDYVPQEMAQQLDGKVVVAGKTVDESAMFFARLNSDGSLDTSFSDDGIVELTCAENVFHSVEGVVVGPSGQIAATGETKPPGFVPYNIFIALVDEDGVPDENFTDGTSGAGRIIKTAAGYEQGNAIVIGADGRILITGAILDERMQVFGYDANGDLDSTFADEGVLDFGFTNVSVGEALSLNHGKVNAIGYDYDIDELLVTQFAEDAVDLSIVASVSDETPTEGNTITYTFTVSNAGPQPATQVRFSNTLPDGLTLDADSLTSSSATCSEDESVISCTQNVLANDASFTVSYDAEVTVAEEITNSATVTSYISDTNSENNTATTTILAAVSVDNSFGCDLNLRLHDARASLLNIFCALVLFLPLLVTRSRKGEL